VVASIEEALGAARGSEAVEVWSENWDIVKAFSAVSTQWRVASVGLSGIYYVGLDYAAARAGLELDGLKLSPTLWEGVRIMEGEALTCLNAPR